MKLLSAGLTLVNVATIAGLLLGILSGGLDAGFAGLALVVASAAAICAWISTASFNSRRVATIQPAAVEPRSRRARRGIKLEPLTVALPRRPYRLCAWTVGIVFAIFAFRSFCWLLYIDGNQLKIQSPYNLGDLALHITYIKYLANGVALWPDNPICVFSALRYPAGIDLWNALLLLRRFDLIPGLVWTGLLGSAATFYALYRWGGAFALAGFLFNGGLAAYKFFPTLHFADYQGEGIAWKSIPLTMFVTQRGLLYAIPAGLLLLLHWRKKYFAATTPEETPGARRGILAWWVEWSLYTTMPLFHVHTFLALSIVLAFWLLIGTWEIRKQVALLLAAAFVPATWIVWMITGHFQAKSMLAWGPGWLQSDPDYSNSILSFWLYNFGLTMPIMIALMGAIAWRLGKAGQASTASLTPDSNPKSRWRRLSSLDSFAFVAPAVAIFLFAFFFKTATWDWDNIKLIIWAYFICLPFLWRDLIAHWPLLVRILVCCILFFSGFVSLFGGLAAGSPGFDLAERTELNAVASVVAKLPNKERFAAFPTYNHPLLLNGRKVVLGYPGHLMSQGFDYAPIEQQLQALMLGAPDWRERARALQARYLFWGAEEKRAYASSSQPWRGKAAVVATGFWGTIYDLGSAARSPRQ